MDSLTDMDGFALARRASFDVALVVAWLSEAEHFGVFMLGFE